jgi:Ca-activated chloride channel family protein
VFAGAARLRVPLTSDVASFVELVRATDPVDVPLGGTNIAGAIDTAVQALAAAQGRKADEPLQGAVLLVTDGEDPSGGGRAAAERARGRGLRVHCIGLGSALGSKVTIRDADGVETFLRDRGGSEVVSRLDAAGLRALAEAGGGLYVDGGSQRPLVEVYERGVVPELGTAAAGGDGAGRANRFQLPLGLGIAALLLELLLPQRRRQRQPLPLAGGPR